MSKEVPTPITCSTNEHTKNTKILSSPSSANEKSPYAALTTSLNTFQPTAPPRNHHHSRNSSSANATLAATHLSSLQPPPNKPNAIDNLFTFLGVRANNEKTSKINDCSLREKGTIFGTLYIKKVLAGVEVNTSGYPTDILITLLISEICNIPAIKKIISVYLWQQLLNSCIFQFLHIANSTCSFFVSCTESKCNMWVFLY